MEFHPLTLEDKPRLDAALEAAAPAVSELTFTNLWVWRHKRAVALAAEAGAHFLLCEEHGRRFFLPPVGAGDPASAAARLVAHAAAAGFAFAIERLPDPDAAALSRAGYAVRADRDQFDYVYAVDAIATLAGRHFDGQRNLVRRLIATRRCSYEPLDDAAVDECLALEEAWCNLRSCALDEGLEAERAALVECLRRHREFGLIGGVIRVDARVKAFSLAERLARQTAVVHFEKADPSIGGLYQLVNHWFCREALAGFTFVNREQDLGIPGLRRAKQGWRPHHLVEKFTVTRPPRG
jgi:hypothetical protein